MSSILSPLHDSLCEGQEDPAADCCCTAVGCRVDEGGRIAGLIRSTSLSNNGSGSRNYRAREASVKVGAVYRAKYSEDLIFPSDNIMYPARGVLTAVRETHW